MKIVKFNDGKYGVRRFGFFSLGYEFLNLNDLDDWFSKPSWITKVDTLEDAEKLVSKLKNSERKDIGEVVQ